MPSMAIARAIPPGAQQTKKAFSTTFSSARFPAARFISVIAGEPSPQSKRLWRRGSRSPVFWMKRSRAVPLTIFPKCRYGRRFRPKPSAEASPPIPPLSFVPPLVYGLAGGGTALGVIALLTKTRTWLPFAGLIGGLVAFLRWREMQDAQKWQQSGRACYLPSASNHGQIRALAVREDILTQNQLTHVVAISARPIPALHAPECLGRH